MTGYLDTIRYQSKKTQSAVRLDYSFVNSTNWHSCVLINWHPIWIWKPINICKKYGQHLNIPFCIALISWKIDISINWLCVRFTYLHGHVIYQQNLKILWLHIVRNRKQRVTSIVKCWAQTITVAILLIFIIVFMCMIWKSLYCDWEHRTMWHYHRYR